MEMVLYGQQILVLLRSSAHSHSKGREVRDVKCGESVNLPKADGIALEPTMVPPVLRCRASSVTGYNAHAICCMYWSASYRIGLYGM